MSLGTTVPHLRRSHMKPHVSQACAAFISLDWADANHAVCLQAASPALREFLSLEHRPEAMNAWGQTLRTRFTGQPVAVGLELTKGPIGSALRTSDCLGLFPVHPLPVATYREALPPMPHSRASSSSNTATSSPHSAPKTRRCAPRRASSATTCGSPTA